MEDNLRGALDLPQKLGIYILTAFCVETVTASNSAFQV